MAIVDLPEPVPPMIAVVWPVLQEKLTCRNVSSCASAKRNVTSRNASTSPSGSGPRPLISTAAPGSGSAICGLWSSTSRTRSQHSSALGKVMITICAIIR